MKPAVEVYDEEDEAAEEEVEPFDAEEDDEEYEEYDVEDAGDDDYEYVDDDYEYEEGRGRRIRRGRRVVRQLLPLEQQPAPLSD